jgi:L-alanine-DL-glutamate epimerase-like enolase superfamily enzyme
VSIEREGHVGRGEAAGVYYFKEDPDSMVRQIEGVRGAIEAGIDRQALQKMLPAGGARNALDCALWDLEAKSSGKSVWELAGIAPRSVTTFFTLGIESTPQRMAARAEEAAAYPILKIKVDGDRPVERVAAIRAVRSDAGLVVDANQGWSFAQLVEFAPKLADLGVMLIEQPLPRGADESLEEYRSPVPLTADESCQHRGELDEAARRYQAINIKLDKAGGLTEALRLAEAIRDRGLQAHIGCRCGTSLALAPAFVVAQRCQYVELDGHLMLERDRAPGLRCINGEIAEPDPRLWG